MNVPTLAQLKRLVGNPDAYSVQMDDGSYRPVREALTDEVLGAHLAGEITVGTYIGHNMDGRTVARSLCLDIDSGSLAEAERIAAALGDLGVPLGCIGIEESGRKGYHVWVPLQDYRPNEELRRMGRAALHIAGVDCELYPKQDEVRDLGNLVKLPGGIHRVTGKLATFLTEVPTPLPSVKLDAMLEQLPAPVKTKGAGTEVRYRCMAEVQDEGVTEGSRNIQLFHLATMLRRAGVSDDNVEGIIERTNQLGDPLEDAEIEALLESSKSSGPICSSIPGDRHCGESCVTARSGGLYARSGQLAHAGAGEHVVVVMRERKGNVIELDHPDTSRIKGVLDGG